MPTSEQDPIVEVPEGFDMDIITSYLAVNPMIYVLDGANSIVDSGTVKPVKKGRMLYISQHVFSCFYAKLEKDNILIFKAEIKASYKNVIREVFVGLNSRGGVHSASCMCVQEADCH